MIGYSLYFSYIIETLIMRFEIAVERAIDSDVHVNGIFWSINKT